MNLLFHRYRALILPVALAASFAGFLLAQSTPENPAQSEPQKVLVVNGKEFPKALAEVGGHYYVSLDSLAQITNGALTIEPNRIVLVTPSAVETPGAAAGPAPPPEGPPGSLTRAFAQQAISALADMREWKAAFSTVVNFGIQVVGTWPEDYRDRVQEEMARAAVAAVSDGDDDTLALLRNEAANLTNWSNQITSQRQSLNAAQFVNPNALRDDMLYQKISSCAQFLNGMIGSGIFEDNTACH